MTPEPEDILKDVPSLEMKPATPEQVAAMLSSLDTISPEKNAALEAALLGHIAEYESSKNLLKLAKSIALTVANIAVA